MVSVALVGGEGAFVFVREEETLEGLYLQRLWLKGESNSVIVTIG